MRVLATLMSIVLLAGCASAPPSSPAPAAKAGGYRVYVTNENSGNVTVIDSNTMTVEATIEVGKRPRGIHASPDGKLIYVALSGSPPAPPGVDESTLPPPDKSADGIGVIDVAQGKVVRVIKAGSDPEQFDLSKDGKTLVVSNEDEGEASFVDLTEGKVTGSVKTGDEPEGVTVSPDGKVVYVTSEDEGTVTVIDMATRKALKTIKVGRRPRSIAFLADATRAYVTNENDGFVSLIDATKHTVMKEIRTGEAGKSKPMHVVLSPDGSQIFVSTGRGKAVAVVDTKTNEVVKSIEVGTRPWGLALSPDGKMLFAADGPAKTVAVIDVAAGTVIKRIPAGDGPWGALVLERK